MKHLAAEFAEYGTAGPGVGDVWASLDYDDRADLGFEECFDLGSPVVAKAGEAVQWFLWIEDGDSGSAMWI